MLCLLCACRLLSFPALGPSSHLFADTARLDADLYDMSVGCLSMVLSSAPEHTLAKELLKDSKTLADIPKPLQAKVQPPLNIPQIPQLLAYSY